MDTNIKTITYENELSNFPTTKITKHDFKNVDNHIIADTINEINSLRLQGKYADAAAAIQKAQEKGINLSQYIVDASTFRTWEEEIYNTQKYAKQVQQSIHFDESEPDCVEGDVWIAN